MAAARIAMHIAPDHPAFAGHFPGRPIVPAVVLLAEALAAIEKATSEPVFDRILANAKFLVPVPPGMPLALSHEETATGRRFEIHSGERLVASGLLTGGRR
jgi:3-hydroxymyristoyl/3-hydroxydecanoyl-(acyl carrier protein) dehydratase